MGARAGCELSAGGADAHRSLVGTDRGHRLERVGDTDDASGQRDLVTREAGGIPGAVDPFVMLVDAMDPLAHPRRERRSQLETRARVILERGPLRGTRATGGVQDPGGNPKLADVMEERGPTQARLVLVAEAELLADELGEAPYPVGVAACPAVVGVQGGRQTQHHAEWLPRPTVA